MKIFMIIMLALIASCKTPAPTTVAVCDFSADSIRLSNKLHNFYDTVLYYYDIEHEGNLRTIDSLINARTPIIITGDRKRLDSAISAMQIANFKLERIRYYLNITLKNPTQDKFLKGWVRRAIE